MFKFENVVRVSNITDGNVFEISSCKKKMPKGSSSGSPCPFIVTILNVATNEKISFEYNENADSLGYDGLLSAFSFYLYGVVKNHTYSPVLNMSRENVEKLLHEVDVEGGIYQLCMGLKYSNAT